MNRIQQLAQARQQAEQQRQAALELQRQQEELEHQRQAQIDAEQKRQAELAARRQQQQQESVEKRQREVEARQRQQQAEAERKRTQPVSPSGETTISRQQFLKWGGLGSVGLITAVGISQVFKNSESPDPDADNNTDPDADNNIGSDADNNTDPFAANSQPSQVDYSRLEELLTAGQWKEADQETLNVMLKIANREEESWLNSESHQNFPCDALEKIDQLWIESSSGKFGFSVQKKIYVEDCGGTLDGEYDEAAWLCLADKVGWRVDGEWLSYSEMTFDTVAPEGHLPGGGLGGGGLRLLSSLVSRLVKCKL